MSQCVECGAKLNLLTRFNRQGKVYCGDCISRARAMGASERLTLTEERTVNQTIIGPLKGRNGKMSVFKNYVELDRAGSLVAMINDMHGTKRLYFKDIGSVQYKKPGLAVGYIQFSVLGGRDSVGITNTMKNENAICFGTKHEVWEPAFIKIKELLENHKNNSLIQTHNRVKSATDEIEKAYELMQKGIISNEEFEKIKKKFI